MVRDEPQKFSNANVYHMKFWDGKNTPTTVSAVLMVHFLLFGFPPCLSHPLLTFSCFSLFLSLLSPSPLLLSFQDIHVCERDRDSLFSTLSQTADFAETNHAPYTRLLCLLCKGAVRPVVDAVHILIFVVNKFLWFSGGLSFHEK